MTKKSFSEISRGGGHGMPRGYFLGVNRLFCSFSIHHHFPRKLFAAVPYTQRGFCRGIIGLSREKENTGFFLIV